MVAQQDTSRYGLEIGRPAIQSAGPITFSPDGILFVADNAGAAIYAIDLARRRDGRSAGRDRGPRLAPRGLSSAAARGRLRPGPGGSPVFARALPLGACRGSGDAALPVLDPGRCRRRARRRPARGACRSHGPRSRTRRPSTTSVTTARLAGRASRPTRSSRSTASDLRLEREPLRTRPSPTSSTSTACCSSPAPRTRSSPSTLRRIPFPFNGGAESSSLEIFHVSHGKYETHSPIRTFVAVRRRREHPRRLHVHPGRALLAGRSPCRRHRRRADGRRARRHEHAARHGLVPSATATSTCSSRTSGTRS